MKKDSLGSISFGSKNLTTMGALEADVATMTEDNGSLDGTIIQMREKYWSEIDTEEKTTRLRQRVKKLEDSLEKLKNQLRMLLEHQHGETGLLIPLDTYSGESERAYKRSETGDNVYF